MQRTIIAFAVDALGDPIARLSCGHAQHVRHAPPFQSRPWVMSAAGRASMLGSELDCLLCERLSWPAGFVAYKQTPVFTQTTIPNGLLRDHATKPGVWARIVVQDGHLRYRIARFGIDQILSVSTPGVVVPEVLHSVEAQGAVRFYVEFYRAEESEGVQV